VAAVQEPTEEEEPAKEETKAESGETGEASDTSASEAFKQESTDLNDMVAASLAKDQAA
jgi:hypothetical protein